MMTRSSLRRAWMAAANPALPPPTIARSYVIAFPDAESLRRRRLSHKHAATATTLGAPSVMFRR